MKHTTCDINKFAFFEYMKEHPKCKRTELMQMYGQHFIDAYYMASLRRIRPRVK